MLYTTTTKFANSNPSNQTNTKYHKANDSITGSESSFTTAHSFINNENTNVFNTEQPYDTPIVKDENTYQIQSDVTPIIRDLSIQNNSIETTLEPQQRLGLGISSISIKDKTSTENTKITKTKRQLVSSSIYSKLPTTPNNDISKLAIRDSLSFNDPYTITHNDFKTQNNIPEAANEDSFAFENTVTTNDLNFANSMQNSISLSSIELLSDENTPNYAFLFVVATHAFDPLTLENEDDKQICIPFEKGDIGFVHAVDESGWGEATMIATNNKGWIPLNFFTDVIKTEPGIPVQDSPIHDILSLLARFILHPNNENEYTIQLNISTVNKMRDGIKTLLTKTNCISRSDYPVANNIKIRKARKKLLAEWYSLMIKTDSYKYSTKPNDIAKLITLAYKVATRVISFYNAWKTEFKSSEPSAKSKTKSENIITEHSIDSSQRQLHYLNEPPIASKRLSEIYDMLISYLAVIIGRMDIIDNNPYSCKPLEFMVHQMIILLNDVLYIGKSCSNQAQNTYHHLDIAKLEKNLDYMLMEVSNMVNSLKSFVNNILRQDKEILLDKFLERLKESEDSTPILTEQASILRLTAARLCTFINATISQCSAFLKITGDFQLEEGTKYIDLRKEQLTITEFLKNITRGITNKITPYKHESEMNREKSMPHRYSKLGLVNRLNSIIDQQDSSDENKPFSRNSVFEKFKPADDNQLTHNTTSLADINNRLIMENEIILNEDNIIIGSSFRGLIFALTDETKKPQNYYMSLFLLNFRTFGTPKLLIDELVQRFDLGNKSLYNEPNEPSTKFSSLASKIKTRRRLVCKLLHTWLENFYNPREDLNILPTIINFLNEGVRQYLPHESKLLIDLAAYLIVHNASPSTPKITFLQQGDKNSKLQRASVLSIDSSNTRETRSSSYSLDERVVEEYELAHISTKDDNNILLPLPALNLGTFKLLSDSQVQILEQLIAQHRHALSEEEHIVNKIQKKKTPSDLIDLWIALEGNKPSLYNSIMKSELNLVELNPLEVAKQITLLESHLYMQISPLELTDNNFTERNKNLGLSPHVDMIIKFTNQLCSYVLESILEPNLPEEKRVVRIKGWIRIALSAMYFRNYNSVASIMIALQNHAVTRLEYLWRSLNVKDEKPFNYLTKIVHPNNNYMVYRKKLHMNTLDATGNPVIEGKAPLPIVPFFNLFLQDLTFISEGNNNFKNPESFRPNKIINIDKFSKITNVIARTQYFQVPYETNDKPSQNSRDSFFRLTEEMGIDTQQISPIPLLQEYIIYEFNRVETLNKLERDRPYQLSISLLPRPT